MFKYTLRRTKRSFWGALKHETKYPEGLLGLRKHLHEFKSEMVNKNRKCFLKPNKS